MFPTTFYPASFQQPPTFGGEFHHPPHPSHPPSCGHPFGGFHFYCDGPREVSPPGTGGPYPPTLGLPGFGFVYGFFAPPPPAFGMQPPPWASPHPLPFYYGPPCAGFHDYQSYSPHCGFHTMRPPPFSPAQRCSSCMAQNNFSNHPGESSGPRYPVGNGAEFPPAPPAPQAHGEPFSPPPGGGDEQTFPPPLTAGHQHNTCDGEMNRPGRNDDSQEQDPRQTFPGHHEHSARCHGKRHAHGPPPPGPFHGPHEDGPRPSPPPSFPPSFPRFPGRRRHAGPHLFKEFGYHAPPTPPRPPFCSQSPAPPCSCIQRERPDPCCISPPHPTPPCNFGPPNHRPPRRGISIGRGHFGHHHRRGWGHHGPSPESDSNTDPNSEDHDDEVELPVSEANETESGERAGREDEWEGIERHERTPDLVSEVTVRDREDFEDRKNEMNDT